MNSFLNKKKCLKGFMQIPGVGKSIAQDFIDLGFTCIADLKNQNPDQLYNKLNAQLGKKACKCMLYVFRCAIYYASSENHDPQKLNWWYWKD